MLYKLGAVDCVVLPAVSRGGQGEYILRAHCLGDSKDAVVEAVLSLTPALGVNIYRAAQKMLPVSSAAVETVYGSVEIVYSTGDIEKAVPSYLDIRRIAVDRGVSAEKVRREAINMFYQMPDKE